MTPGTPVYVSRTAGRAHRAGRTPARIVEDFGDCVVVEVPVRNARGEFNRLVVGPGELRWPSEAEARDIADKFRRSEA